MNIMANGYTNKRTKDTDMDLHEYHTVTSDILIRQTPAIKEGINSPHDWLWSKVNDVWHPIIKMEKIKYCNCMGACAKAIKPSGVTCEDELFTRTKH